MKKTDLSSLLKQADMFHEVAVSLLARWGLDYALAFLFTRIETCKPICHIHCVLRNTNDTSKIALGEVGMYKDFISANEPDIYKMMGGEKEDFGPYIATDVEIDPIYRNFYESVMRCHSLLRIPIFRKNEYVCFIGVWAQDYAVFTEEDLHALEKLLAPFGKSLSETVGDDFQKVQQKKAWSHSVLLQMCSGLREQVERLKNIAKTGSTVLITGETGSGKGVVAKAIHEMSPRARHPFVPVNCGSIPETLMESQFFGHERGSFTGAAERHAGCFEQANRGTIFLDEVAELSLSSQARLLHVLDDHSITRVGGREHIHLDIRVIAATNKDLRRMVRQGTFREDLFYRLSVYPIHVPPLRERPEDIMPLVHHMMALKAAEMGVDAVVLPSEQEKRRLCAYRWPGNVRELEYLVERAVLDARRGNAMVKPHFELDPESNGATNTDDRDRQREIPVPEEECWGTMEEIEQAYLRKVLEKTGGRIYGPAGAAAILGVHPLTIRHKMEKFGLAMEKSVKVSAQKTRRDREC